MEFFACMLVSIFLALSCLFVGMDVNDSMNFAVLCCVNLHSGVNTCVALSVALLRTFHSNEGLALGCKRNYHH
jgi:hypothetical protein